MLEENGTTVGTGMDWEVFENAFDHAQLWDSRTVVVLDTLLDG
jgi:hypothetical protein